MSEKRPSNAQNPAAAAQAAPKTASRSAEDLAERKMRFLFALRS